MKKLFVICSLCILVCFNLLGCATSYTTNSSNYYETTTMQAKETVADISIDKKNEELNEEYRRFLSDEIAKKIKYDADAEVCYFEYISIDDFFDKLEAYDYGGSNDIVHYFDKPVSLDVICLKKEGGTFVFSSERYKNDSNALACVTDQIFYKDKNVNMVASLKNKSKKQEYLLKKFNQFEVGDKVHIEGVFQWLREIDGSIVAFLLQDVYPVNLNDEYTSFDKNEKNNNKEYIENNSVFGELEKLITDNDSLNIKLNDAYTQADMSEISNEIANLWADELNLLRNMIKNVASESEYENFLQEEQDWKKEKEKRVKAAGEEYAGGSIRGMIEASEDAKIIKERVFEVAETVVKLNGEDVAKIEELKNDFFASLE